MATKANDGANEFARGRCPSSSAIWIGCSSPWNGAGSTASSPRCLYNVFYLSGFNGVAHKADEPRPCAVVLSRHAPGSPILVVADYYLATFLTQPNWVEDIRPFRAVMIPLDLPPNKTDIDRFIPPAKTGTEWVSRARRNYAFDMGTAVRSALKDLRLDLGQVAFDDMAVGFRLGIEGMGVGDGYDALMFERLSPGRQWYSH